MKKSVLLTIFIVCCICVRAQFTQKGSTLEYNGRNPRTIYTKPVSLNFKGAANAINTNGRFELFFNRLTAGKLINSFDIGIADTSYVLFNKPSLQRWILTKDLGMEVLLCRKSIIDNTKDEFIRNHEAIIKKKYDEKIDNLQREVKDAEEYNKRLINLNDSLMREMEEMKEKAVFFAFVDEANMDSIHYEMRKYEIKGEYDKAAEIGRSINYSSVSDNLMHNIELSMSKSTSYIDDLFNLQVYLEQQIYNIKNGSHRSYSRYSFSDYNTEIHKNYQTLHKTYRFLINLYSTQLRCESDFLENLKERYAIALFKSLDYYPDEDKDSLLHESAKLNYFEAILQSAEKAKTKAEAHDYYVQALNTAQDDEKRELILERLQSFADFHDTSTGDTIYYHILSATDKTVAITDFHHPEDREEITIPAYVKHNNVKFTVTKLAYNAFGGKYTCNWPDDDTRHVEYYHGGLSKIYFPKTLTEIGTNCFHGVRTSNLIIPGNVKVIDSKAFSSCSIDTITIREGVETIADNAFYLIDYKNEEYSVMKYIYGGRSYRRMINSVIFTDSIYDIREELPVLQINLPSSLKTIYPHSFNKCYHDKLANVKVSLNPKNKYYQLIDGVLYDNDTTLICRSLMSSDTRRLYVGSKMKFNSDFIQDIDTMLINWDDIVVSAQNPYYISLDGVCWSKTLFSCILPTKKHSIKLFHHLLSDSIQQKYYNSAFCYDMNGYSTNDLNQLDSIVIPKLQSLEDKSIFDFLSTLLYNPVRLYKKGKDWNHWPIVLDEFSGQKYSIDDYLLKLSSNVPIEVVRAWAGALWSIQDSTPGYRKNQIPIKLIKKNYTVSMNLLQKLKGLGGDISQKIDTMMYRHAISLYWLSEDYKEKDIERAQFYADASIACFDFCYNNNFEKGNCANYIGNLYSSGKLADGEDLKKAYHYYCISARDSSTWYSASNIGHCYQYGKGVEKDILEAERWYKKAMELGDSINSPCDLANIYCEGLIEGGHDYDKAYHYYTIAVDKGNTDAMNDLAYLYAKEGFKKRNIEKSFEWIDKALELKPNSANYHDSKGEFFLMIGDTLNAKRMYYLTLEKDSTYAGRNTKLFTKLSDAIIIDSIHCEMIYSLLHHFRKNTDFLVDLKILKASINYTRPNWDLRVEDDLKDIMSIKDDAYVMNLLGMCSFYIRAEKVKKWNDKELIDMKYNEALQWFLKSANKGYHPAYRNVALVYKKLGKDREADFWFKKAGIK